MAQVDELTRYVFVNFSKLKTLHENLAARSISAEMKAQHSQSSGMQQMLRTKWVSQDPKVLRLLENGAEQFYLDVVQRILREHPSEVFLNHCPRCQGLARTPQSRQCRHCFYSWHDKLTRVLG